MAMSPINTRSNGPQMPGPSDLDINGVPTDPQSQELLYNTMKGYATQVYQMNKERLEEATKAMTEPKDDDAEE